jgi:hypothetical protein
MKPEESGMSRRSFLTTTGGLVLGVGIAHLPGTAHAEVMARDMPAGGSAGLRGLRHGRRLVLDPRDSVLIGRSIKVNQQFPGS